MRIRLRFGIEYRVLERRALKGVPQIRTLPLPLHSDICIYHLHICAYTYVGVPPHVPNCSHLYSHTHMQIHMLISCIQIVCSSCLCRKYMTVCTCKVHAVSLHRNEHARQVPEITSGCLCLPEPDFLAKP